MISYKKICYILITILSSGSHIVLARNVLLEFKGAYFLPTNHTFKKIFHNGGALYGPELTVQLSDCWNWYGFASIDYFQKKGHSIGLDDRTNVSLLPIALGLKYFVPVVCDCADLYAGLGFQTVRVHTKNDSAFVIPTLSKWGFGGIAKLGVYCYLPHNFFLDFSIDYSAVSVKKSDDTQGPTGTIVPLKPHVNGAIFAVGLGYRF